MKRPPNLTIAALALAPLLFCAACASNRQRVVVSVPPASLLSCAMEPRVPAIETDATTAQFIIDALAAGQDCRSKVQALRVWTSEISKGTAR